MKYIRHKFIIFIVLTFFLNFVFSNSVHLKSDQLAPVSTVKISNAGKFAIFGTVVAFVVILSLFLSHFGRPNDSQVNKNIQSEYYKTSQLANYKSIPSFPGAMGYASYIRPGINGQIIEVSSLEDYDKNENPIKGTLRYALENADGPRTVVFNIGGEIKLKRQLSIDKPNIYIAGQTAPGKGIYIKNAGIHVNASNVVLRYLRIMPGTELVKKGVLKADENDALGIRSSNVLVANSTIGYATDENLSLWDNPNDKDSPHDNTIQNCIIANGLRHARHPDDLKNGKGHSRNFLMDANSNNNAIVDNLFANSDVRSPEINGPASEIIFANNVVYNWGPKENSGLALSINGKGNKVEASFLHNYFIPGKDSNPNLFSFANTNNTSKIYVEGFSTPTNFNIPLIDAINKDPIKARKKYQDIGLSLEPGFAFKVPLRLLTNGELIYEYVFKNAGPDVIRNQDENLPDWQLKQSMIKGTGTIIDDLSQLPADYQKSFENKSVIQCDVDEDKDGIPESFEKSIDSNPQKYNPYDQPQIGKWDNVEGYTNIELYLSWIAGDFQKYIIEVKNFLDLLQTKNSYYSVEPLQKALNAVIEKNDPKEIIPVTIFLMKYCPNYLNTLINTDDIKINKDIFQLYANDEWFKDRVNQNNSIKQIVDFMKLNNQQQNFSLNSNRSIKGSA